MGYNLEVAILGIEEDNPFFDVNLTDSKSDVVISSAMAEKYGMKKGDVFVVEDEGYDCPLCVSHIHGQGVWLQDKRNQKTVSGWKFLCDCGRSSHLYSSGEKMYGLDVSSYGIKCILWDESSLSMADVCDCVHCSIGTVFCNEWVIGFKA